MLNVFVAIYIFNVIKLFGDFFHILVVS
jgi:hypothetical protein